MELDLPFSDPVVEDVELSVLEYARGQGICVDYTRELPQLIDVCLSLKDTIDQDLRDPFDDDLTNAVTAANELIKERLRVSRDVASLLKSVLTMREPLADDPMVTDGRQWILDMKQELPVLQTDAELDMLNFGTRIEPDYGDLRTRLPSEHLDEENDEGLTWPTKYFAYPAQCDARIRNEKLAVTRDALILLQNAVRDDFTPEDDERMMKEEREFRRRVVPRYLTPPLPPLSPPITPYVPSSPVCRIPLASESCDSVMAEARALEQQIMAKDSLIRHHSGSSDSMLLDVANLDTFLDAEEATSPHFPDRTPTVLKRRADELKVEGPLTPPILSDSPMKKLKSVSFADMIQVRAALEPWADLHRFGSSDSLNATEELSKRIGPIANEAKRKVENEKLIGADTVSRVQVPCFEFIVPEAPWDEFSQRKSVKQRPGITELEAQMRFLVHIKRNDMKSATAWRGASDLDLRWGWFTSATSTMKLDEKLHGESDLKKIQSEFTTGVIATSSNEVWKRDGLRILNEEDEEEEEELELAEDEECNEMEALIRKRKLEMEEKEVVAEAKPKRKEVANTQLRKDVRSDPRQEAVGSHHWQNRPVVSDVFRETRQTAANSRSQQLHLLAPKCGSSKEPKEVPTELMFGSFSASTALHKFMETQGKAIMFAEPVIHTKAPSVPPPQNLMVRDKAPSVDSSLSFAQESGHIAEHPSPTLLEPPPPPPPLDLPPSSIIVSSSLLQRRTFLKQVEHFHPKAELIYRDYTLPHSASAEADIILSPSTGLFLTTLQQIKQAPLPGQAARSPVKERMTMLQERYERLIVLVSENLREEAGHSRPEDPRDTATLNALKTFAANLQANVTIAYIRGGDHALARAVVEKTKVHGLPSDGEEMRDIKLFAMETTWEVVLRRAGINPFAAQVILASLKHPVRVRMPGVSNSRSADGARSVEVRGLSRFLVMSGDERIKAFQAVMGGGRVLRRVSALLDWRWVSAVHGFSMDV